MKKGVGQNTKLDLVEVLKGEGRGKGYKSHFPAYFLPKSQPHFHFLFAIPSPGDPNPIFPVKYYTNPSTPSGTFCSESQAYFTWGGFPCKTFYKEKSL